MSFIAPFDRKRPAGLFIVAAVMFLSNFFPVLWYGTNPVSPRLDALMNTVYPFVGNFLVLYFCLGGRLARHALMIQYIPVVWGFFDYILSPHYGTLETWEWVCWGEHVALGFFLFGYLNTPSVVTFFKGEVPVVLPDKMEVRPPIPEP